MSSLTLDQAATIVDGALAAGRENRFQPLTVVVLDPGGHVIAAKREDGSGILRYDLALGKAYGSLGFGLGSRTLTARAAKVPGFMMAASVAAEGRLVPAPGGVLIRDTEGRLLGAVGISGDTGDNDEICALVGIVGTGLVADPGA
ncbi:MAG: heme-binding protein [Rhodobacteraceae bacterium]|nr:heme-binding protein [Paracoccaceae bacterium]